MGDALSEIMRCLADEDEPRRAEIGLLLGLVARPGVDRIDAPNKTRLFAIALFAGAGSRGNQFFTVLTEEHCATHRQVPPGEFRVQVQVKGEPDAALLQDWERSRFSEKPPDKTWWERDVGNVSSQEVDRLMETVSYARDSFLHT